MSNKLLGISRRVDSHSEGPDPTESSLPVQTGHIPLPWVLPAPTPRVGRGAAGGGVGAAGTQERSEHLLQA